jgi:hypothetical protein
LEQLAAKFEKNPLLQQHAATVLIKAKENNEDIRVLITWIHKLS